jgi:hypothetical protein
MAVRRPSVDDFRIADKTFFGRHELAGVDRLF